MNSDPFPEWPRRLRRRFSPLSGGSWFHFFRVPSLAGSQQQAARFIYVSPGYFQTLGIPIRDGRNFLLTDTAHARRVLLVNERFVHTHLGNLSPIGASIRTIAEAGYPEVTYEIVGVVGNTKYSDLREEMPPIAYVPIAQDPGLDFLAPIIVRANVPLAMLTPAIAERVKQMRPSLSPQFTELKSQVRERLAAERATAWLAGAFGVLAIVMVTIGLYGIIAYMVVCRRQEIGIPPVSRFNTQSDRGARASRQSSAARGGSVPRRPDNRTGDAGLQRTTVWSFANRRRDDHSRRSSTRWGRRAGERHSCLARVARRPAGCAPLRVTRLARDLNAGPAS